MMMMKKKKKDDKYSECKQISNMNYLASYIYIYYFKFDQCLLIPRSDTDAGMGLNFVAVENVVHFHPVMQSSLHYGPIFYH
jgi:hypothetical protein